MFLAISNRSVINSHQLVEDNESDTKTLTEEYDVVTDGVFETSMVLRIFV